MADNENLAPADYVLDASKAPLVLEALQMLLQQPGWKIYAGMCEGVRRSLQSDITKQEEPNKLLRTSGALGQVELLASWPERQIKAIAASLKRGK